ncbi:hypothetical protein GCM10009558_035810 [Virgisporangium aurantiacum]
MTEDPMTGDSMTGDLGDWTPEQYEANGRLAFARIAALRREIRTVPVAPAATPAQVRGALDPVLPRQGRPFAEILDDTWATVVPHLTHWHHPSFHAYFSNSSSGPGVVADAVVSALNVNSMLWTSSPAASAVEEIVIRWVCRMIGYPDDSDGVIVNGASLGTFYALNAARDAVPGLDARTKGVAGRPDVTALRVYATSHAHSSVDKAVIALGIGLDNLVRVPCDKNFAMLPSALADLIAADRRAGLTPVAVVDRAPPPPARRTRSARSPRCAGTRTCGCTSTPRTAGCGGSCRTSTRCRRRSTSPTRSWSTRTRRSSCRWSAACCCRGGAGRWAARSGSSPIICPHRTVTAPSTTWTGRFSSAGRSGR